MKNNTVSITGANDLSAATLYGSSTKNAAASRSSGNTGNRLNMTGYSGKMQNIGNFNWVDLSLDGVALSEEKRVVELTSGNTDFSWTSVNIHTSADYGDYSPSNSSNWTRLLASSVTTRMSPGFTRPQRALGEDVSLRRTGSPSALNFLMPSARMLAAALTSRS